MSGEEAERPRTPFVIEGWRIAVAGGVGIEVSNVTKALIIRNNQIVNGDRVRGVCIQILVADYACAPSRACIPPAVCLANPLEQVGIRISHSEHISIADNAIGGNSVQVLVESSSVSMSRNSIQGRPPDVLLQASDQATDAVQGAGAILGQTAPRFSSEVSIGILILDSTVVIMDNIIEGFRNRSLYSDVAILARQSFLSGSGNVLRSSLFGMVIDRVDGLLVSTTLDDVKRTDIRNSVLTFRELKSINANIHVCGDSSVVVSASEFIRSNLTSSSWDYRCPNPQLATVISENVWKNSSLILMSGGVVTGNRFDGGLAEENGSAAAIILEPESANAFIGSNQVANSTIGVLFDNSTARFEGNEVVGNDYGTVSIGYNKPSLRENSIVHNTISVHNTDRPRFSPKNPPGIIPLDARWNWWGSSQGPPPDGDNRFFGNVLYEPWLVSPPAGV